MPQLDPTILLTLAYWMCFFFFSSFLLIASFWFIVSFMGLGYTAWFCRNKRTTITPFTTFGQYYTLSLLYCGVLVVPSFSVRIIK